MPVNPSEAVPLHRSPTPMFLRVLTIVMLFFACQGHFSFQLGEEAVGGALPGSVPTRVPSFLGDILIPGVTYSIVLYLISKQRQLVFSLANRFYMLTLLGILAALSAVWSQNPLRSLGYGTFYLVGTLFAYWLVIRFEPEELRTLLVRTGFVACLLGLLLVVFVPTYGTAHDARSMGAWRGLFSNRTAAAKVLVFLLSPALVPWGKRISGKQIIYVLLLSLMIVQLHAVSSFVVMFFFILTLAFLRYGRTVGPKFSLVLFVFGLIFGLFSSALILAYLPDLLVAMGRDPTLTGRTTIWSVLIASIMKQPLLGYGFYAFWQGLTGESARVIHATNWTFGYAHNGYIEVFLQLGLAGGAIFATTLLKAIRDAWVCFRFDKSGKWDWYIGLLVITLIYNIDEATVFWPNDLTSILYVVLCCSLTMGAQQLRKTHHPEVLNVHANRLSLTR